MVAAQAPLNRKCRYAGDFNLSSTFFSFFFLHFLFYFPLHVEHACQTCAISCHNGKKHAALSQAVIRARILNASVTCHRFFSFFLIVATAIQCFHLQHCFGD